jgi:hypothetical protein
MFWFMLVPAKKGIMVRPGNPERKAEGTNAVSLEFAM